MPAQAGRAPRGAPIVGVQVPAEPSTLQASHWPSQAALQQTPSTHMPDTHWAAAVHVIPLGTRATHMPSRQKLPAAHSTSVSQLVRHAVAEQA